MILLEIIAGIICGGILGAAIALVCRLRGVIW